MDVKLLNTGDAFMAILPSFEVVTPNVYYNSMPKTITSENTKFIVISFPFDTKNRNSHGKVMALIEMYVKLNNSGLANLTAMTKAEDQLLTVIQEFKESTPSPTGKYTILSQENLIQHDVDEAKGFLVLRTTINILIQKT